MMDSISLINIEETHKRACERIVQLFSDEMKVNFIAENENHHEVAISFTEVTVIDDVCFVTGVMINDQGEAISSIETKLRLEANPIKKVKKQVKNLCLLKLMESYTGIIQPWGILTGIRPTKLYHSMRREGLSVDNISQQLSERYSVQKEKIELLANIATRQLAVVPDLDHIKNEVSIYIGIPFCPTMCAYCTFPAYAINGKNGSVEEFLTGLHYEMEVTGTWLKERNIKVTTIYYGGGTPTSITAREMDALYEKMYQVFPMADVRELTVEAGRPDTISPEKIEVLKKWNVDRISVNPQSFTNETLKAIGRHHSVEETIDKYKLSMEMGMTNINMDLIIGLPGEGVEELSHTLQVTSELKPASLTVHTLSYKRASQMTKYKEKYKVADRDEIHEMMKLAEDWMNKHSYAPYYLYRQKNILGNLENVGYAMDNHESIYNIMIMEELQTIIGLGCGASSKWVDPRTGDIDRYANPKDPQTYIDRYKDYTHKKVEMLSQLFPQ
ncbi:coproporphyrinogen III oxidase [Evansella cellulosilytica]|uniref:Coproporphyrinogen dehydrogenase n=1 Tax=Evansella cellulosilytica (strain ATCC 21833 / DSM 2522 / FERM P-1141 / JCM 9156 / N-4) TaxID=649639 RepID=E6TUG2_EVAC2|nr:coproporphyrinogen III oxidase [Evansella cellulosilytica]ADU29718.1 Coproporphyrinogen dehydrogenase [Evansella cellulosilytica DSM 2522]